MKKEIFICGLIALFMLAPATSISSYIGEDADAALGADGILVPEGPKTESRDFGDLQFMYGVEQQTGDFQSIGCACDDQYFYVTGGNNGNDPNKVYIFDFDGNYVDSFDQSGTTGWGWLDLAWDGDYFYGGPEGGSRIDVFTEDGTVVNQIPGPVPWCAGIAYDPATDHLWTIDKWTDMVLYEIDMDGNVVKSWAQDKNAYGIAWDDLSPGGPYIWVAVQDPQCTFYQFDPAVGDYTGVSFEAENPGSVDNKACGLDFTTAWNTSAGVLFGIQQCDQTPDGPGDQLAGYTITELDNTPPVTTCELEGEMDDDEYIGDVTVYLNATDAHSGVKYTMYKLDGEEWQEYEDPFVVSDAGEHIVRFYSIDNYENEEEEKSCTFTIKAPCCFEVLIPPGFGIGLKAKVTEICDESHTGIPWEFKLSGGLFLIPISPLTGKTDFAAGEIKDLNVPLVFGLGSIQITFTIGEYCDPVTANAFIIGPFVIVS
jgi:hypothetical protein